MYPLYTTWFLGVKIDVKLWPHLPIQDGKKIIDSLNQESDQKNVTLLLTELSLHIPVAVLSTKSFEDYEIRKIKEPVLLR